MTRRITLRRTVCLFIPIVLVCSCAPRPRPTNDSRDPESAAPASQPASATGPEDSIHLSLAPPPIASIEPQRHPASSAALRLVDRARALRRRGDAGLARETLERAIEIDPANGSAYYDLAELHLDEGRPEQATTLAEKAILLGPQYGDEWLSHAHVLRGRALESSSRPNEAAAAYRRALELHAGNLPARIALRRLN